MAVAQREEGAPSASLAQRLAGARVGLRDELEVSRHLYHRQPAYILRDPISFDSHRLNLREYRIVTALQAETPLGEIFNRLVEAGDLQQADQEAFYGFIVTLHRLGLLSLPVVDDKQLYNRHLAKKRAGRKQLLLAPIFFRIPLFNPDAFLSRTIDFVRPLTSMWAFIGWLLLVLSAGVLALFNARQLAQPLNSILALENLTILWVTLIALKVLHEFGHAYACKVYGGHVPEMGVYLIACTPCAYVDATSAWGFPRKRQRLAVCLAGVYVELAAAAAALWVWCFTDPASLANAVAYNVALLASVVTLAFNINPLMRYDGYYALSDLIEAPNLRSRSRRLVMTLLKRGLLGAKPPADPAGPRFQAVLVTYGVASTIYRACLVLSIAALVATKAVLLGLTIAVGYVGSVVFGAISNLLGYLRRSPEVAPVKARAWAVSLVLMVAIPIAILYIPLPVWRDAPAVIASEQQVTLRARRAGFLRSLAVASADDVAQGDVLATLENADIQQALTDARAAVRSIEVRQQASAVVGMADVLQTKRLAALRRRQLEQAQDDVDALTLRAPVAGRVLQAVGSERVGSFIQRGEPVATICSGEPTAVALIDEDTRGRGGLEIGREVTFRTLAAGAQEVKGKVFRIAPAGAKAVGVEALAQHAGGDLPADPRTGISNKPYFRVELALEPNAGVTLPQGAKGAVRFTMPPEPLGRLLKRKLLRFTTSLRQ